MLVKKTQQLMALTLFRPIKMAAANDQGFRKDSQKRRNSLVLSSILAVLIFGFRQATGGTGITDY